MNQSDSHLFGDDNSSPDIDSGKEKIEEQLAGLIIPISDITQDPANARKHDERNIESIKGSLDMFGQRKPIVVRRQGMTIIAGNGTVMAAKRLGWKRIAAVIVDDDITKATAFGIADNRTAELAGWDSSVLGTLLGGLQDTCFDMTELGFTDEEIDVFRGVDLPSAGDAGVDTVGQNYSVVIECTDLAHQEKVLTDLMEKGYKCRAIM